MSYLLKLVGVFLISMAVIGLIYNIEYRLGIFGASSGQGEPRTLTIVNDTDYFLQVFMEGGDQTKLTKLMIAQIDSGRNGFTTWTVKDSRTFRAYTQSGELIACKQTSWDEMERTGWILTFRQGDISCQ